jgi:hypothetical protein
MVGRQTVMWPAKISSSKRLPSHTVICQLGVFVGLSQRTRSLHSTEETQNRTEIDM